MNETVKLPDYCAAVDEKIFNEIKEMIANANDEQLRMLVFGMWLDLHRLKFEHDLGGL